MFVFDSEWVNVDNRLAFLYGLCSNNGGGWDRPVTLTPVSLKLMLYRLLTRTVYKTKYGMFSFLLDICSKTAY